MLSPFMRRSLCLLLLSYSIFAVCRIAIQSSRSQWDFFGYYHCANQLRAGLNPYDTAAVAAKVNTSILPYVYPPATLLVFLPFTFLAYPQAAFLYLLLKCCLLVVIVALWRTLLGDYITSIPFLALCIFGFNATLYCDLRSGNIATFELIMITFALIMYVRGKICHFCGFIAAAATFKLQPILFLAMLPAARHKDWPKYFCVTGSCFGAYLFLQYAFVPAMFQGFVANAANTLRESGIINPSTYAFIRDVFIVSATGLRIPWLGLIHYAVFAATVAAVLAASSRTFNHVGTDEVTWRWQAMFATLVYALVSVRFKDYSYGLLIPAAYYILRDLPRLSLTPLIVFILSMPVFLSLSFDQSILLPGSTSFTLIFWNYYPLVSAYGIWWLYLRVGAPCNTLTRADVQAERLQ